MFILDGDKINEFLRKVSESFYQNPIEIILSIVGILFFLVIPPLIYILLKKHHFKTSHINQKNDFIETLSSFKLLPEQEKLLQEMGEMAWKKRRNYQKLFKSILYFFWVGEELIKEKIWNIIDISLLANKIPGIAKQNPPKLYCTANLKPYHKILLAVKGGRKIPFLILDVNDQGLMLKMPRKFQLAKKLRFYFMYDQAYYFFETQILSQQEDKIFVAHSQEFVKIQKRQYYRKPLQNYVGIKWINSPGLEEKSRLKDLSGGGAKIIMVEHEPQKGEPMILILPMNEGNMQINGQVVRVENPQDFSIKFDKLPDAKRDKIIKNLVMNKS